MKNQIEDLKEVGKKFFRRSPKDILMAVLPSTLLLVVIVFLVYRFADPAPPKHFVISTGDGEGDYQTYAKLYKDIISDEGVDLEIRPSKGAWDNMRSLEDPNSDVDVGFVQDGLGTVKKAPDVSSLGSLYYEPIWIFYRGNTDVTRFSQFVGKKLGIGEKGGGTHTMAKKLLAASGVDEKNSKLIDMLPEQEAEGIKKAEIDVAFFTATPSDRLVSGLLKEKNIRLMSLDQAEAITRQFPYLHHVVLPHGTIDLKLNIPARDTDLVSPTATLLVRDSLHPALIYLLLKAISQVHTDPGIFEKKNEFPIDNDYVFPLAEEAKNFYKSGAPFWQRYLPFWLATLVERFILLVIPALALILPIVRTIPKILERRVRARIYQRYGELKYLETQIKSDSSHEKYDEYLEHLDKIEDRVNHMKVPLDFSDYVYVLREHIHFVRERIERVLEAPSPKVKRNKSLT